MAAAGYASAEGSPQGEGSGQDFQGRTEMFRNPKIGCRVRADLRTGLPDFTDYLMSRSWADRRALRTVGGDARFKIGAFLDLRLESLQSTSLPPIEWQPSKFFAFLMANSKWRFQLWINASACAYDRFLDYDFDVCISAIQGPECQRRWQRPYGTVIKYGSCTFYACVDYTTYLQHGHELYLTSTAVSYEDIAPMYLTFHYRPPHEGPGGLRHEQKQTDAGLLGDDYNWATWLQHPTSGYPVRFFLKAFELGNALGNLYNEMTLKPRRYTRGYVLQSFFMIFKMPRPGSFGHWSERLAFIRRIRKKYMVKTEEGCNLYDSSLKEPFHAPFMLAVLNSALQNTNDKTFKSNFAKKALKELEACESMKSRQEKLFGELYTRPYEDIVVEEFLENLPRPVIEEIPDAAVPMDT
ncbi:GIP [Symbiodinium sp. CCMP2456]|nr:GIP [Symbiodinium sp. CCMP2456]